jgi:hypothetical protein
LPIPREAPVTTATRPDTENSGGEIMSFPRGQMEQPAPLSNYARISETSGGPAVD